jgi:HEAT repeat protein
MSKGPINIETLLRWLVSGSRIRRTKARHRLVSGEEPYSVRDFLGYLGHASPVLRRGAVAALCEMHLSPGEVAAVLHAAETDNDEWVRYEACYAIPRFEQRRDTDVNETLVKLLDDKSWHVRYAALEVISDLKAASQSIARRMIVALADPQWNVRSVAATAIGSCGVTSADAIEAFRISMFDKDRRVRVSLVEALGAMPSLNETAELIAGLIADVDVDVQLAAISVAVRHGRRAGRAMLALEKALTSPNFDVQTAARSAILVIRQLSSEKKYPTEGRS